jgi:WD40 repeat protein/tRNA A-37 threonylcarbamoyl transferase component Bud32
MPEPSSGDRFPTLHRLAPLSPAELLQLLLGKQRQDWERGERVPVERYLERLRAAGESWLDEEGVLDLLYNEIVLREERGERPTRDEYRGRFPQYADQLDGLFGVHEGLRDCSFWKVAPGTDPPAGPLGPMPPAADEPTQTRLDAAAVPRAAPEADVPTLAVGDQVPSPHDPTAKPPTDPAPVPAAPGTQTPWAVATHRPARLPLGREIIPGYEILGELGRGGMGVVYKARQVKLRRLVALKMILAGAHARADDLVRFKAEAEAVARLQHPNIIQIYEVGEHDGLPYFSLEFCAGGSLAARLNGTPLPAPEAAQLIETLARAVHAAHQQQVVHRDLKPANILLTADGRPKITDFGLAKKLDEGGRTHTGEVMGTPSYMAPEQAAGRVAQVGFATDVYSLGAILYELLTGRAPFRAATPVETLHLVLHDDPVTPSRLQPHVPRDLETVCLKCLQKEPERRYSSALELAEDLQRFRSGESIRARPVSLVERGVKWARQRPAVAGLLAAVVAVTALAFLVVAGQLRQTEDARRRTAAALADRETQLYFNHIALADREWLTDHAGRVEELLALCPPDLRSWEWRYLRHLCHCELLTLPGRDAVAFSPDSTRLAVAEGNDVHLRDARTGRDVVVLRGHRGRVTAVAFGPGGRVASASDDESVKVWDADGKARYTCPGHADGAAAVAFSPDGRRLASATGGLVLLWDAVTGARLRTLAGHPDPVTSLAFSADGGELFSAGWDGVVRRWDVTGGRELARLEGHAGRVNGLVLRPDGRALASAGDDETIILWDPKTGRPLQTLAENGRKVTAVAFSPDGKVLASAAGDDFEPGEVKLWDLARARPVRVYRGHRGVVRGVAFAPDGRRLASADRHAVKVWDATQDQEERALRGDQGPLSCVAAGPDGRLLAAAGADGTVRLWDEAGGREVGALKGHRAAVAGVTFCGDTGRLATAGFDNTVRVWDLQTRRCLRTLEGHRGRVWCVASSADGSRLASSGGDGSVKLWDPVTGEEVVHLDGHKSHVGCVAFSPDGTLLASGSIDRTVRLWDVRTGKEVRTLEGHELPVSSLAFSPDGTRLASGGGTEEREEIRVWEVATGREVLRLGHQTGKVLALAFSHDGRRLASASEDQTVRVWDTAGGLEVLTLRGHHGGVYGVVFGPDDRWLASAGADGTVRIWEAPDE